MVFNVSIAMNWILFLALFPIAFFWFRRAWRIIIRRDWSDVALKRGVVPANPGKFAPYVAALNIIGGIIVLFVIGGVVTGSMEFDTWTAIAGSTIWMKFMFDFLISRHAHPMKFGKAKADKADNAA